MVASALTRLNCPQGEFELQRYPSRNREPLRAWCAADVLLLEAAKASSVIRWWSTMIMGRYRCR